MGYVLLLNGSCHEKGNTYIALNEIKTELAKHGVDSRILWLGTGPIQDCIDCRSCWSKGKCVFDEDLVNRIIEEIDDIAGLIVGSPVYYGGPSGRICSVLDRLFYSSGSRWAGKLGASVVCCRRGGATASFDRLNNFFLMNNMVMPSSQYWNQIHGFEAGDALNDGEGLQTMRTLAVNIAWMLDKLKDAEAPAYEERISTNFIR